MSALRPDQVAAIVEHFAQALDRNAAATERLADELALLRNGQAPPRSTATTIGRAAREVRRLFEEFNKEDEPCPPKKKPR